MENYVRCCLRVAIELKAHGLEMVTREVYFPKENRIIPFYAIPEDADLNDFFALLSAEECLSFFWLNSYSVCLQFDKRRVWAEDMNYSVEFKVVDPNSFADYNEADLMATLIMQMLRKKYIDAETMNSIFKAESIKWRDVVLSPKKVNSHD